MHGGTKEKMARSIFLFYPYALQKIAGESGCMGGACMGGVHGVHERIGVPLHLAGMVPGGLAKRDADDQDMNNVDNKTDIDRQTRSCFLGLRPKARAGRRRSSRNRRPGPDPAPGSLPGPRLPDPLGPAGSPV